MHTPEATDAEPPKSWIWNSADMDETRGLFLCVGPIDPSPVERTRLRTLDGPFDVFMVAITTEEQPVQISLQVPLYAGGMMRSMSKQ
jgi:hypothetical protein